MPRTVAPEALCCSFCTKSQLEVHKLVAGPGVFICDECVDLCNQVIADDARRTDGAAGEPAGSPEGPGSSVGAAAPPALRAWDGLSDDELLAEMVRAHAAHVNVDRAVRRHVAALRDRGVSWTRIGEALHMTRQSAWERFSGEE